MEGGEEAAGAAVEQTAACCRPGRWGQSLTKPPNWQARAHPQHEVHSTSSGDTTWHVPLRSTRTKQTSVRSNIAAALGMLAGIMGSMGWMPSACTKWRVVAGVNGRCHSGSSSHTAIIYGDDCCCVPCLVHATGQVGRRWRSVRAHRAACGGTAPTSSTRAQKRP